MKAVAAKIKEVLANDVTVTDIVGTDIHWSKTDENVKPPFIIYDVVELKGLSKDRREWRTIIRCFANDMDAASDIYEGVKTALELEGHHFVTGNSGITDDEHRESAMELNFNLKNI